jgi:ubiquinone/menaquinone biosynthesis C-methylase UbiE
MQVWLVVSSSLSNGRKKAIGIEDLDLFFLPGRDLFSGESEKVEFVKSECGYIPLQPETADLVIMNEVISHINPIYLPVVYSEIARVLLAGGMLFISDGNNLAHATCTQERLLPLYQALENGPDGTQVGDVVVQACFLNQRKRIIENHCSKMPAEQDERITYPSSNFQIAAVRIH